MFLNLIKRVQPLSLAYLNVHKYKEYVEILYQSSIASIFLCKRYVSGNVKDGVTKFNEFWY